MSATTSATPILPRGRPKSSARPETRQADIETAFCLLGTPLLGKQVAAALGLSRATVYRRKARALGYDDAEAEGLKRLPRYRRPRNKAS